MIQDHVEIPEKPRVLGTLVNSDMDEMVELISTGNRDCAPIYFKDHTGLLGIRGAQGLYRLGQHADGRMVLLFAVNPHDLDPYVHTDPEFKNKIAPGYWLSNNPEQLRHVVVVEARREYTNRMWVVDAIHDHNKAQKNDKIDYGFLYRVSETLWVSGAIAYELEPLLGPSLIGEPLYTLKCYTTAGRGRPFRAINKSISENRISGTMKLGAASALVTMAEAEDMVREDFAKRVDLVMRDLDPRLMGHLPNEPDMSSRLSPSVEKLSHRALGIGKNYGIRLLQGVQAKFNDLKTPSIVITALKIAYYIGVELVIRGVRSAVMQVAASGVEILDGVLKKPTRNDAAENVAHGFWGMGRTYTGAAEYHPLDPAQAMMISLVGYDEANVRPEEGAQLRSEMSPDWPLEYFYNLNHCPLGSIFAKRQVSNATPVHIKQPNGLEQYNLIGWKTVFSRYRPDYIYNCVQPLPGRVKSLLCEEGGFLKVFKQRDTLFKDKSLNEQDTFTAIVDEAGRPAIAQPRPREFHLLNEFNKAAAEEALPKTKLALAWVKISAMLNTAREKVGMVVPEKAEIKTPKQLFLEKGLSQRVPAVTTPAHPSSHTGQAAVSQPIAQP